MDLFEFAIVRPFLHFCGEYPVEKGDFPHTDTEKGSNSFLFLFVFGGGDSHYFLKAFTEILRVVESRHVCHL